MGSIEKLETGIVWGVRDNAGKTRFDWLSKFADFVSLKHD